MLDLSANLLPEQRGVLAIDKSEVKQAMDLMEIAQAAGIVLAKLGLELSSATSWKDCSELASLFGLDWVADAKLHDISNTVAATVSNLAELDHKPSAITIHTKTGEDSLREAQKIADEAGILMLGVTHLTSIPEDETKRYEKVGAKTVVWRETRRAVAGGIGGFVCSGKEVGMVKKFKKTKHLTGMIPGTRSTWAPTNDQRRVTTPEEAMEAGADLLVIGRQVTAADDPAEAYSRTVDEMAQGMLNRQLKLRRGA